MRIGLVAERFDPQFGGLEQWTVALARYLLARGHLVDVVAFGGEPQGLPIRLHRVTAGQSEAAKATVLDQKLQTLSLDVVYDTGLSRSGDVYQPQTGSRLGSLDSEIASFGTPRRIKAALSPRTQTRRRQLRRIELAQIHRASHIVAVSDRVRALLIARDRDAAGRITVIRNGTDLSCFEPGRLRDLRQAKRAALGIGADELLVVSLAHNLRLKGVDTTVRALAPLAGPNRLRLAIAGGAPDPALRKLIAATGMDPFVRALGPIDDADALLAAGDVYVHPSRWDACSVSTVEALAAGLPVITSRMDGAADFIVDGRSGHILQHPDDVTALTGLLVGMLDPDHRRRLSVGTRAGRAALAQDYAGLEAVLVAAAEKRRFAAHRGRHSPAT